MDITRNQYFMAGIVVLLLGIQLRVVESYVLTPKTTQILAKHANTPEEQQQALAIADESGQGVKKILRPPEWTGWCLLSIGAVLILHSLAMKKEG